jgi:DNA-binding transcriptional LysR family regulator
LASIPHLGRAAILAQGGFSQYRSADMHSRIDWEDLRHVLAVADANSLGAAARALGVNHSTVLRRVNAFEERLGLRLFERLPTGYALTAGGEELLAAARAMADTVATLERRLQGRDLRLEGELRVTTTDTLLASPALPNALAAFRERHPGIVVEVSTPNTMANLMRRDADVAIRPTLDPPEALVGRRLCGVAFAPYASPAYLASSGTAPDASLAAHRWVAPDASLAGSSVSRWMRAALPDAEIVLRADSLLSLRQAALAGLGAAALPCYLGDATAGLRRIAPPVPEMATALWVLTHEDLRRTARVSAFTEFVARALVAERALFEGLTASPAAPP